MRGGPDLRGDTVQLQLEFPAKLSEIITPQLRPVVRSSAGIAAGAQAGAIRLDTQL